MKITVVGAGNVGATCASVLAEKEIGHEIVLLDVRMGLAEGKALDMLQMAPLALYDTKTVGVTNDYVATAGSSIVVITAGVTRKPGMTREDLISTNAVIVREITEKVIKLSPDAIFIVVTNPLDAMTYCVCKTAAIRPGRVIGMAGLLDSARYRAFLAEALDCSSKDIQAVILGGHGDHMVPLVNYTTVSGVPIKQLLPLEKINEIINRTRIGGGELINLMGKSAWYAPGFAAARMVEAIAKNQKRFFSCSAYLNGEYGLTDMYFGVPVKLGQNGIEKILELELTDAENQLMQISAQSVQENIKILYSRKII
jgi:malate dehydrogenase